MTTFTKPKSNEIHQESLGIFNEILEIKNKIFYELIQKNNVQQTTPPMSNWRQSLTHASMQEREVHARIIGREYRVMQWEAHLYSLAKEYQECCLDLFKKMSLQHESIAHLVSVCRPGEATLLWRSIEKKFQYLALLNKPIILFNIRKYRRLYNDIEFDDFTQILWVIMMQSLQKFDPERELPFIIYFNTRAHIELMRRYENENLIPLSSRQFLQFFQLKRILASTSQPYTDSFKKKCEYIFEQQFDDLLNDFHNKSNLLNPSSMDSFVASEKGMEDVSYDLYEILEKSDMMATLNKAMEELDDRTKRLLLGQSHEEDVDLSPSQAQNIKKKGLGILRKIMDNDRIKGD